MVTWTRPDADPPDKPLSPRTVWALFIEDNPEPLIVIEEEDDDQEQVEWS